MTKLVFKFIDMDKSFIKMKKEDKHSLYYLLKSNITVEIYLNLAYTIIYAKNRNYEQAHLQNSYYIGIT